jgi:A-factor biosynthesis hotdog domain/PilZ domain
MYTAEAVNKVDKYLVHKDFEDDLLIYNGRGAIPLFIDDALLGSDALSAADVQALTSLYRTRSCSTSARHAARYFLEGIPAVIQASALDHEATSEDTRQLIHEHYVRQDDCYLLSSKYINELDESKIVKAFAPQQPYLAESARIEVSAILDRITDSTRPMVYYVNMYNDTKNYFFYRKHHEHVPGIMLIEVARQAMYAHFYRCRDHRREEISLSIDSFHMDYLSFTESNYPVRIRVEDVPVQKESGAPPQDKAIRLIQRGGSCATFYQRNKIVAVATISATLIKINLFNRLRRTTADETHRFFPIKNIANLVLLSDRKGRKREAKLHDISMKGLCLTLGRGQDVTEGEALEISLYVEGVGFLNANAQLKWRVEMPHGTRAGFALTEMADTASSRLKEIIKNYTYVNQSRAGS